MGFLLLSASRRTDKRQSALNKIFLVHGNFIWVSGYLTSDSEFRGVLGKLMVLASIFFLFVQFGFLFVRLTWFLLSGIGWTSLDEVTTQLKAVP